MSVYRVTTVACFCSLGCFVMGASTAFSQDVANLLAEAHDKYEQSIEQIERDAITRLDELIDRYSDEGNLQKVLELRAQKTKLLEDRAWPESVVFRTMREKIRSARVRAKRDLATAYEEAIAALTKERKYDDAVALRKELEELAKVQAAFDFRSEEPKRKKPEGDAEDPKPENKPLVKKGPEEKAGAPGWPHKGAAIKQSQTIDLAAFLAMEASKIPLDGAANGLSATSHEKRRGLFDLIIRVHKEIPPRDWTARQCDDFVEFFSAAALSIDSKSAVLPAIAPDPQTGVWQLAYAAGESASGVTRVKAFVVACPSMQWLVSSPTPSDFIARAAHLQSKEYWQAVDEATKEDTLKLWLKSVGCRGPVAVKKILGELKDAGVKLAALEAIQEEVAD